MNARRMAVAAAALAALPAVANAQQIEAELVASGFQQPVLVTAPPGDPRLFVVDQPGRIFIVADGEVLPTPFLDIRDLVGFGGERGLLGLAFHPDFARNGGFFVNYTDRGGDTQIVEYGLTLDADAADPGTAQAILEVAQPAGNHNGGWIAFGPDGYLYIGMGDGGGGGDAFGNGQNLQSLLAKILRIDVSQEGTYGIPPGNPFAQGGGTEEMFAFGLRNPWRNDFDGDLLWIADVGQNQWEEINVVSIDDAGVNFGWPLMEGFHCFRAQGCNQADLVTPVYEYSHNEGCSITGGYVYRGSAIPALQGAYVFGDYCAGFVRSFRYNGSEVSDLTDWTSQIGDIGRITSFGEDAAGELYIAATGGNVYKIVPAN